MAEVIGFVDWLPQKPAFRHDTLSYHPGLRWSKTMDIDDSTLLYRAISVICQTLVYGIYLCLFPIAVYVLLSRGLYNRSRTMLFVAMVIMFALSTIYWVMSVVATFMVITAWFSDLDSATHSPPNWLPIIGSVLLINFIITDGVVVWRAWVICSDQNKAILVTPVVILAIDSLAYLTTVVVKVGLFITSTPEMVQIHNVLIRITVIAQMSNLVLSLLTNAIATSIIAAESWKYRKSLTSCNITGHTSTLASKVLGFLVESGLLYILTGLVILATFFIRLCFETVGDILTPMSVQLAGIYPIVVLLVVDLTNSFKSTSYRPSCSIIIPDNDDQASHLEPLNVAPSSKSRSTHVRE